VVNWRKNDPKANLQYIEYPVVQEINKAKD